MRIVLVVGLWLGLAMVAHAAGPWWEKGDLWQGAGFFVNGLVQLAQETWHHNLFESARANLVFGHLLGWLVGISYEPMRHDHLLQWAEIDRRPPRQPLGRGPLSHRDHRALRRACDLLLERPESPP